jgi:glycosyltransferase involved in cell wall biosynthesis
MPRLQRIPAATFLDSPLPEAKSRILRQVQAVLITSQTEETSSLVAMEAAACGTPVIATRRGALPKVVMDGITGFLIDGIDDAVLALKRLDEIDPARCVGYARKHFSSATMAEGYAAIYANSPATLQARPMDCPH